MIDKIQFLVPNLDRRPDRWHTCLGALLANYYPDKRIIRFSAHDATHYNSFEDARNHAAKQFPHSNYIRHNKLPAGYYCWSWTWYDIMTQIAHGNHGELALLMIDDFTIDCRYRKLERYINILKKHGPIKCVQLAIDSQRAPNYQKRDPLPIGEKVPFAPFFHGIHASGDFANLFSPTGAREILNVADTQPDPGVPNWVFDIAANTLTDTQGYYTVSSFKPLTLSLNTRYVDRFQDAEQM